MVGARGFEPPTTSPPAKCATRLRYAPKRAIIAEQKMRGEMFGLHLLHKLNTGQRLQMLAAARRVAATDMAGFGYDKANLRKNRSVYFKIVLCMAHGQRQFVAEAAVVEAVAIPSRNQVDYRSQCETGRG